MVTVNFTEQQINNLLTLLDSRLKAEGLTALPTVLDVYSAVAAALEPLQKAAQEAAPQQEVANG